MRANVRLRGCIAKGEGRGLDALSELIEAGRAAAAIDRTWALNGAPNAIRHLHEGRARGTVITV